MNRIVKSALLVCGLSVIGGCQFFGGYFNVQSDSGSGASGSSSQQKYYVEVWLDNSKAERDQYVCHVSRSVSRTPRIKYDITEPEKIGRVKNVIINVFREFDGGWSSNADFIVTAVDANDPDAQMKRKKVYNLGDPGDELRIMDGSGKALKGMKLEPRTKYRMNFVVSADRSETVSIEFKTQ